VEPGVDAIAVSVSPWLIAVVAAVGLLYVWVLVRAVMQMRRGGVAGVEPMLALVGTAGTAQTVIGPTGIAYAGGESWSARTRGSEIGAGTPVRVLEVEGLELIVEPASATGSSSTEG
jgi:membrane-bound ClpP family serine protease